MRNTFFVVIILGAAFGSVFAQTGADSGATVAATAQQKLKEISVSKMEDAGFWYGAFPADNGIVEIRSFEGGSQDKVAIEDEEASGIDEPDERVVGMKVSFYRRGIVSFTLKPIRPLPIEGLAKTISVWVAGRNANHQLEMLISDQSGNVAVLPMGKLNFAGWKKVTVTIPPHIKQVNYPHSNTMGIYIEGLNIKCDIDQTYGRYYIYFDDMRAVTDLFSEESRDLDDMMDGW